MKIDGRIYIILAAILWGTTGTSQAFAPSGATPLAVGAFRLIVGGLALFMLAQNRGNIFDGKTWDKRYTLVSGLSTACYQLTFFAGVSLTGVAVGTMIAIGSAPIFTGILGRLFRSEQLDRRWMIATAIALLGCIILISSGDESMQVDPLGVLLSLGAGLSYAVFALVNKFLIDTHQPDAVMAVSFGIGTILLLPILLFVDINWAFSVNGLLVILHLGLLATGLSYALFGRGLQTASVSIAGTLALAEPLTASLLGVFVLGEQLTVLALVGIALLFIGLAILATK